MYAFTHHDDPHLAEEDHVLCEHDEPLAPLDALGADGFLLQAADTQAPSLWHVRRALPIFIMMLAVRRHEARLTDIDFGLWTSQDYAKGPSRKD